MDQQKASTIVHEIFESWAPCLARHAWRATGDRALADDLVQEAFFALYKELRAGKEIENPRAWLLTVVRHSANRHHRDAKRHGEHPEASDSLEALALPSTEPSGISHEALSRMLSVLSEREEEVVLLRMDCFKYREIADQLGISGKTVATLLARALRKLQRSLQTGVLKAHPRKEHNVPKTLQ